MLRKQPVFICCTQWENTRTKDVPILTVRPQLKAGERQPRVQLSPTPRAMPEVMRGLGFFGAASKLSHEFLKHIIELWS